MLKFNHEIAVVAEEERPRTLLGIDTNEDAGTLKNGVDTSKTFFASSSRNAHVVLTDVLKLERRGPAAAAGKGEDELRSLRRSEEVDLVTSVGDESDLVRRAEFSNSNFFAEVVLDDEARAQGDDLAELVLWRPNVQHRGEVDMQKGKGRTSPRPSVTFKPTRTSSLPVVDGRMTSVSIPTVSKLSGCDQFDSPMRRRERLRRSSVGYENIKGSFGFRLPAVAAGGDSQTLLSWEKGERKPTARNLAAASDRLGGTEEGLGLQREVQAGLVEEDVRRVDLDAERSSGVGMFSGGRGLSERDSRERSGGRRTGSGCEG